LNKEQCKKLFNADKKEKYNKQYVNKKLNDLFIGGADGEKKEESKSDK
jgi:hypothetical protein